MFAYLQNLWLYYKHVCIWSVVENTLTNIGPKRPTDQRIYQRDIAKHAGVSISTVSRVLGNAGGIS
ncbi:MAG: helix-turn-helix domain-containing protein, partial [Chloroflexota bacterium]